MPQNRRGHQRRLGWFSNAVPLHGYQVMRQVGSILGDTYHTSKLCDSLRRWQFGKMLKPKILMDNPQLYNFLWFMSFYFH